MTNQRHTAVLNGNALDEHWRVDSKAWWLVDPPEAHVRAVAFGGGTGVPVVLRGLKRLLFPSGTPSLPQMGQRHLTAVVTVADDGGSSGRLRSELQVPAPGDARNCLLALADDDGLMSRLFEFRFESAGHIGGHNLGNLILSALCQMEDGFDQAVEQGGKLLGTCGDVLPCTLDGVVLRAEFADGTVVSGESSIATVMRPISRVMLEPADVAALPEAVEAVEQADVIVLGPGSLYTSVIPPLLVKDIAAAIRRSRARVVLVMNLMTEPGETGGYTAVDHIRAVHRHVDDIRIDDVLVNSAPIPDDIAGAYARAGAAPVVADARAIAALGVHCVERPLLAPGTKIRHDEMKLARVLLDLAGVTRV
jgi:uncharacterized cofD-like protein